VLPIGRRGGDHTVGTESEVRLPDIGDFSDVDVIEVLVSPGDRVRKEDSLISLESDKATMEIPSPSAGIVKQVKVTVGDKLNQGDLILLLEEEGAGKDVASAEASSSGSPKPEAPSPVSASAVTGDDEIEVRLPDIGDFAEVDVIEVLVAEGDQVKMEDSLVTLESDKATMEIPSPHAGVIRQLKVQVGDKISQGQLLLTMQVEHAAATEEGASLAPAPAVEEVEAAQAPAAEAKPGEQKRLPGEKEPQHPPVMSRPADVMAIAPGRKPHASPSIRRFARELGVDLLRVQGSGPKGRISKDDVQRFVQAALRGSAPPAAGGAALALPALPEVDFEKFGEIEVRPLGRIQKVSGAHLHRSWLNVPHVTQFDEADITDLEAFRKEQKSAAAETGVRLTLFPFLLKACARALRDMPEFNSSLAVDGEHLVYKKYCHIGVAVDTANGLLVPVIRDVDQKGVFDLARELAEVSERAREGKLSPMDMQGGCFSISSLGGIGGTAFTPIVNAPEVAILGVSRSTMQPRWNGTDFEPRLVLPLALSYDHRVIDGAQGVRFTTQLAGLLSDVRRLLL